MVAGNVIQRYIATQYIYIYIFNVKTRINFNSISIRAYVEINPHPEYK